MSPQDKLLFWFHKNKRDLPFRNKPTAYRIWVSEVMLQQTRVSAMLPIYNQFLLRFPDMESLSQASEEEVMANWRGLGYYSRARNLRKACMFVMSNYNGRFPDHLEDALEIPGVGPYTARAVLSMAYNKSYAVLDGNVKRVISRLFTESDEKKWQDYADQFLNRSNPGDHNQAMMELGSMVCSPNPNCAICPIAEHCKAKITNTIALYPPAKKDREKLAIQMHFYIIRRQGRFLLVKDRSRRFFKDMYALPFRIEPQDSEMNLPTEYKTPAYIQELIAELGTEPIPGTCSHSITHHKIQIHLHRCIKDLDFHRAILHGGSEKFTDYENLERDFPSSISKKMMNFSAWGGLFPS
ncbi:A/G-specific adenine glycosylase [Leptospira sp. GIMC2001]|uniref:A/G-specific adenine glycosylase n=1 Tax=Leptospira sp. GIMC2001 TaxID=1513297 RepID=UPI00234A29C2|nr:A/G-specific adenine glycosylase [Leptospira sp. GIMC2001]WCL48204.1 A/G-specific adenine glycosylase [Leptospira sp. GIMC2001]